MEKILFLILKWGNWNWDSIQNKEAIKEKILDFEKQRNNLWEIGSLYLLINMGLRLVLALAVTWTDTCSFSLCWTWTWTIIFTKKNTKHNIKITNF